jgi:hypothetical protein
MGSSRAKVLLVNDDRSAMRHLFNYLRSAGCLCSLTRSYEEACALFRRDKFDLVLSRFAPSGRACHELVMLSAGAQTSFFYFYAVEHGCWWIPRVRFGQECWGETALHPRQFAYVLERLIQEIANGASAGEEAAAETTRRHMQTPVAAPVLRPLRVQHWRSAIVKLAASAGGPKANGRCSKEASRLNHLSKARRSPFPIDKP